MGHAIATEIDLPTLERGGRVALAGIAVTAGALLLASALDAPLGWPTALTGTLTTAAVLLIARKSPVTIVRSVSWSVLPLVAGLFMLVEAVHKTGITHWLTAWLTASAGQSVAQTTWVSGVGVALLCNVLNNLPAGLLAGSVLQLAHVPEAVQSAVLLGVDLGPNLSVTGSLATLLWLVALRRENIEVTAWQFLRLGVPGMLVPLLLAIASLLLL